MSLTLSFDILIKVALFCKKALTNPLNNQQILKSFSIFYGASLIKTVIKLKMNEKYAFLLKNDDEY
jgi:hypothetical protein